MRGRWLSLVLALTLLQAPALAWSTSEVQALKAGELLTRDVPVSTGGAARAAVFVRAPVARVREVLWHHERYPSFIPHSRSVKVLEQHGNRAVVEMTGGEGPITVSYVTERVLAPDRISWHTLSGDVKANDGYWAFEATPGGTVLTYEVHVVPKAPVPGAVVAFLQKQALPGLLRAVKAHIETTPAAGSP